MTGRIAVRPETVKVVREFSKGLDLTHDEMIRFMLKHFIDQDEDPLYAGRRLRDEAKKEIGQEQDSLN